MTKVADAKRLAGEPAGGPADPLDSSVHPHRRAMKYLNLGCGDRFHPDWANLDLSSTGPGVRACDLRRGIPAKDGAFDAVYVSHLLEHFPRKEAQHLLKECHRVLRPGGIIRLAVPDLERIARTYLEAFEKALCGDPEWQQHYDWIMLELYDQVVRERSGGEMLEYLRQDPISNEPFVQERIGGEARRAREFIEVEQSNRRRASANGFFLRLRRLPNRAWARLLRELLGEKDYRALEAGRFRMSGEVHHWMYDRFSLGRALQQAGFEEPRAVGPAESRIPNWADFHLDTEPDGTVYKPDSLYMEAVKP